MPVYSHSRLSTYETCPQQYKIIRYIDRKQPLSGEEGRKELERVIKICRGNKLFLEGPGRTGKIIENLDMEEL